MWPLAGGLIVLGGVLPSLLLWLQGGLADADLWRIATAYTAVDIIFSVTAIAVLWIGVQYGNARGPASKKGARSPPAPYPGAWVEANGVQQVPQGFPFYLAVAFATTIIAPCCVLAYCLLHPDASLKALACATLAPYLLVFLPQALLETKFLNRSFMTPMLPVLYAYYRFWQFIRSLGLFAGPGGFSAAGSAAAPHSWLLYYLVSLLCFWAYDTGCTLVWMPGMYEWQLQDVKLLTKLAKQQEEQQQTRRRTRQQAQQQNGEEASGSSQLSSPAIAAKLRHRWRLAGSHRPADSGDLDSYTFGS